MLLILLLSMSYSFITHSNEQLVDLLCRHTTEEKKGRKLLNTAESNQVMQDNKNQNRLIFPVKETKGKSFFIATRSVVILLLLLLLLFNVQSHTLHVNIIIKTIILTFVYVSQNAHVVCSDMNETQSVIFCTWILIYLLLQNGKKINGKS